MRLTSLCTISAYLALHTGAALAQQLPPHVRAVRADAPPGGDGRSWAAAYNDVQAALLLAAQSGGSITQLWIAQGQYQAPAATACQGFPISEVSLYGGFEGNELAIAQRPPGTRSTLRGGNVKDPCTTPTVNIDTVNPVVIDSMEFEYAISLPLLRIKGPTEFVNVRVHGGTIDRVVHKTSNDPISFTRCALIAEGPTLPTSIEIAGPGFIRDSELTARSVWGQAAILLSDLVVEDSALTGRADNTGIYATDVTFRRCQLDGHAENCVLEGERIHLDQCTFFGQALVVRVVDLADSSIQRSSVEVLGGFVVRGYDLDSTSISDSILAAANSIFARLRGSSTIVNSRFTGWAGDSGIIGGSEAAPHFVNCALEFTAVAAPSTWRALELGPGWRFDNCIIWPNSPTHGPYPPQVTFSVPPGLTGFINNSIVRGWDSQWTAQYGGIGNSGANPLLNPDGSLQPGSPAIDAGNTAALPPGFPYDLARNCRIADGDRNGSFVIDIGAYEYPCYPNADCSTAAPILNVADFAAFLTRFAAGDPYANCDQSTTAPVLNIADFACFLQKFAAGCP